MMPKRFLIIALIVVSAAAALGGCTPDARVDWVDGMEMRTPTMAADWDGLPGADGLNAQVFMYRNTPQGLAETVTVSGTLEVLMFEGRLTLDKIGSAEPFHKWSFAGKELASHTVENIVGWGYAFQLPFGDCKPAPGGITLVARYRPKDREQWRYSAANSSITIDR